MGPMVWILVLVCFRVLFLCCLVFICMRTLVPGHRCRACSSSASVASYSGCTRSPGSEGDFSKQRLQSWWEAEGFFVWFFVCAFS